MTLALGGTLAACTEVTDIATTGEISAAGAASSNVGGAGGSNAATGGNSAQAGSSPIEESHSLVPADEHPDISDAEYATYIAGANRFGLELAQTYATLSHTVNSNAVFSPNSAQVALAMAYAGAVGNAAEAMRSSLHDPFGTALYHVATNRMLRELASRAYVGQDAAKNEVRVQLSHANSIWGDRSLSVKTPFLDVLAQNYNAGMRRVDFVTQPDTARRSINDWVSQKTQTKIVDLLGPLDITSETRVALVNALYFYGSWSNAFNPANTQDGVFHTRSGSDVTTPTMHGAFTLPYKAASNYSVVQLPYVQGQLRMTIVVPAAGAFESVRDSVSLEFVTEATSGLTGTSLNLALPKFKIATGQMNLNAALEQNGMMTIFDDGAFAGISDDAGAVAKVVQKAFIGADEFGTEASAATAVIIGRLGLPSVSLNVDRPFLFFVQDQSGLILFSGQVVDPSQ
jgi:serpin B